MNADTITLGNVDITRVVEWSGPVGTGAGLVPGAPAELWREHRPWLEPDFWSAEDDTWFGTMQTWVVRSEGRTLLVDTGVGNGRERPSMPHFSGMRTDFLGRLRYAGVRPEDVDVVVNTHIHFDHVGWNTRWDGGGWVPTFPNATYLIPRADRLRFDPAEQGREPSPRNNDDLVFQDSIAPVLRADQAVLWEDQYRLDGSLTLRTAPGHTPGSSVLHLSSGSDRAVFVGDMVHSPVQVVRPEFSSCFCEDPAGAAASRRRVLGEAADTRALVIPAHFPGHGAAEVRHDGADFALANWAAWPAPKPGPA
ncbi:MBL fold metallo-hydrolase [Streptomyces sp. ODS28]|uniref:MBL fold metallo-hydrolase n=1 Tax=Streptomyces sp. ODS28 TaxID=3136688 RepID=UPI0031E4FC26